MENVPVGPNSKPLRPVIVTEVSAVGTPRFLLRLARIFYYLIHCIIHCFIMPSAIARFHTLTATHSPFRAVWRNVEACRRQFLPVFHPFASKRLQSAHTRLTRTASSAATYSTKFPALHIHPAPTLANTSALLPAALLLHFSIHPDLA
jgi:hypothetical protein